MNPTTQEKIDLVTEAKRKLEEAIEMLHQADLDAHAHAYLVNQLEEKLGGDGTSRYEFDMEQLLDQLRDEGTPQPETKFEFGKNKMEQHLEAGTIWWSETERTYLGKASDGVTVQLMDTKDKLADYLFENPDPVNW